MKHLILGVVPLLLAGILTACSPSESSYALIGIPGQYSYTDSANILIGDGQCSYAIYRGDGVTPPEVVMPCTLLADKKDALGNPHAIIEIGFNTSKGPKTMTLNAAGTNNENANKVPNIGVYLPRNWTLASGAPVMTLKSNASGSIYSAMTVHIGGVRCSLAITAIANNRAVSMPCGLTFWGHDSVSISIPGALVSTEYAGRSWPLNFSRNSHTDNWDIVKVPNGFPVAFTAESASTGS